MKASGYRNRLFRAVHAEAVKRGFDHDSLRDICRERFGVHSMSRLADGQLNALYHEWTGKGLRRKASLPRAEEVTPRPAPKAQIVSGEELVELGREFARREMGDEARAAFVRRQLRGRGEIRTRRDYVAVIGALRAMNKRDGLITKGKGNERRSDGSVVRDRGAVHDRDGGVVAGAGAGGEGGDVPAGARGGDAGETASLPGGLL